MPTAEFRLYFDNEPADEERLSLFCEIRVDQAIGMAAEAELSMGIGADDSGVWSGIEEDFTQPFARVRVEVKVGDGDFVPLLDGPIVGSRFELEAAPEASKLIVVAQDDSVLLNQEEGVELYEDMATHEIVEQIFSEHGLTPEVESTPVAGAGLTRYTVRRGTSMQLLRELARRHGMFVYVRAGASPGSSVGVFARPSLAPSDAPALKLLGADRNVASFRAELDALKPLTAEARSVGVARKAELTSETTASDLDSLGDAAAHDVVAPPAKTLLARTREEQTDLDEATASAVNLSSFAYSASAEVEAESYAAVLQPYQVLTVLGVGGYLSGDYLISRVTHVINGESYKQQIQLRRNARSAGGGGGGDLLGRVL